MHSLKLITDLLECLTLNNLLNQQLNVEPAGVGAQAEALVGCLSKAVEAFLGLAVVAVAAAVAAAGGCCGGWASEKGPPLFDSKPGKFNEV